MNFDEAIESHKLWKGAFLHYIKNHQGKLDIKRIEGHLNLHENKFGSILKMIGLSPGGLSIEFIESCDNCHIGQWISSIGGMFQGNRDFVKLVELHTKCHKLSAKILREIEREDKKTALGLVAPESEFSKVSDDIETDVIRSRHMIESG